MKNTVFKKLQKRGRLGRFISLLAAVRELPKEAEARLRKELAFLSSFKEVEKEITYSCLTFQEWFEKQKRVACEANNQKKLEAKEKILIIKEKERMKICAERKETQEQIEREEKRKRRANIVDRERKFAQWLIQNQDQWRDEGFVHRGNPFWSKIAGLTEPFISQRLRKTGGYSTPSDNFKQLPKSEADRMRTVRWCEQMTLVRNSKEITIQAPERPKAGSKAERMDLWREVRKNHSEGKSLWKPAGGEQPRTMEVYERRGKSWKLSHVPVRTVMDDITHGEENLRNFYFNKKEYQDRNPPHIAFGNEFSSDNSGDGPDCIKFGHGYSSDNSGDGPNGVSSAGPESSQKQVKPSILKNIKKAIEVSKRKASSVTNSIKKAKKDREDQRKNFLREASKIGLTVQSYSSLDVTAPTTPLHQLQQLPRAEREGNPRMLVRFMGKSFEWSALSSSIEPQVRRVARKVELLERNSFPEDLDSLAGKMIEFIKSKKITFGEVHPGYFENGKQVKIEESLVIWRNETNACNNLLSSFFSEFYQSTMNNHFATWEKHFWFLIGHFGHLYCKELDSAGCTIFESWFPTEEWLSVNNHQLLNLTIRIPEPRNLSNSYSTTCCFETLEFFNDLKPELVEKFRLSESRSILMASSPIAFDVAASLAATMNGIHINEAIVQLTEGRLVLNNDTLIEVIRRCGYLIWQNFHEVRFSNLNTSNGTFRVVLILQLSRTEVVVFRMEANRKHEFFNEVCNDVNASIRRGVSKQLTSQDGLKFVCPSPSELRLRKRCVKLDKLTDNLSSELEVALQLKPRRSLKSKKKRPDGLIEVSMPGDGYCMWYAAVVATLISTSEIIIKPSVSQTLEEFKKEISSIVDLIYNEIILLRSSSTDKSRAITVDWLEASEASSAIRSCNPYLDFEVPISCYDNLEPDQLLRFTDFPFYCFITVRKNHAFITTHPELLNISHVAGERSLVSLVFERVAWVVDQDRQLLSGKETSGKPEETLDATQISIKEETVGELSGIQEPMREIKFEAQNSSAPDDPHITDRACKVEDQQPVDKDKEDDEEFKIVHTGPIEPVVIKPMPMKKICNAIIGLTLCLDTLAKDDIFSPGQRIVEFMSEAVKMIEENAEWLSLCLESVNEITYVSPLQAVAFIYKKKLMPTLVERTWRRIVSERLKIKPTEVEWFVDSNVETEMSVVDGVATYKPLTDQLMDLLDPWQDTVAKELTASDRVERGLAEGLIARPEPKEMHYAETLGSDWINSETEEEKKKREKAEETGKETEIDSILQGVSDLVNREPPEDEESDDDYKMAEDDDYDFEESEDDLESGNAPVPLGDQQAQIAKEVPKTGENRSVAPTDENKKNETNQKKTVDLLAQFELFKFLGPFDEHDAIACIFLNWKRCVDLVRVSTLGHPCTEGRRFSEFIDSLSLREVLETSREQRNPIVTFRRREDEGLSVELELDESSITLSKAVDTAVLTASTVIVQSDENRFLVGVHSDFFFKFFKSLTEATAGIRFGFEWPDDPNGNLINCYGFESGIQAMKSHRLFGLSELTLRQIVEVNRLAEVYEPLLKIEEWTVEGLEASLRTEIGGSASLSLSEILIDWIRSRMGLGDESEIKQRTVITNKKPDGKGSKHKGLQGKKGTLRADQIEESKLEKSRNLVRCVVKKHNHFGKFVLDTQSNGSYDLLCKPVDVQSDLGVTFKSASVLRFEETWSILECFWIKNPPFTMTENRKVQLEKARISFGLRGDQYLRFIEQMFNSRIEGESESLSQLPQIEFDQAETLKNLSPELSFNSGDKLLLNEEVCAIPSTITENSTDPAPNSGIELEKEARDISIGEVEMNLEGETEQLTQGLSDFESDQVLKILKAQGLEKARLASEEFKSEQWAELRSIREKRKSQSIIKTVDTQREAKRKGIKLPQSHPDKRVVQAFESNNFENLFCLVRLQIELAQGGKMALRRVKITNNVMKLHSSIDRIGVQYCRASSHVSTRKFERSKLMTIAQIKAEHQTKGKRLLFSHWLEGSSSVKPSWADETEEESPWQFKHDDSDDDEDEEFSPDTEIVDETSNFVTSNLSKAMAAVRGKLDPKTFGDEKGLDYFEMYKKVKEELLNIEFESNGFSEMSTDDLKEISAYFLKEFFATLDSCNGDIGSVTSMVEWLKKVVFSAGTGIDQRIRVISVVDFLYPSVLDWLAPGQEHSFQAALTVSEMSSNIVEESKELESDLKERFFGSNRDVLEIRLELIKRSKMPIEMKVLMAESLDSLLKPHNCPIALSVDTSILGIDNNYVVFPMLLVVTQTLINECVRIGIHRVLRLLQLMSVNEYIIYGAHNMTGDDVLSEDLRQAGKAFSKIIFLTDDSHFRFSLPIDKFIVMSPRDSLSSSGFGSHSPLLCASESWSRDFGFSKPSLNVSSTKIEVDKIRNHQLGDLMFLSTEKDRFRARIPQLTEIEKTDDFYSTQFFDQKINETDQKYRLSTDEEIRKFDESLDESFQNHKSSFLETPLYRIKTDDVWRRIEESVEKHKVLLEKSRLRRLGRRVEIGVLNRAVEGNKPDSCLPPVTHTSLNIDDLVLSIKGGASPRDEKLQKRLAQRGRDSDQVESRIFADEADLFPDKFDKEDQNVLKVFLDRSLTSCPRHTGQTKTLSVIGESQLVEEMKKIERDTEEVPFMRRVTDLYQHMIESGRIRSKLKPKDRFISSFGLKNMGVIISPGKPSIRLDSKIKYRLWFIVDEGTNPHDYWFFPELTIKQKDGSLMLVSRQYMHTNEFLVHRSRLYHNMLPLRLIGDPDLCQMLFWSMFFVNSLSKGLISSFKYLNVVFHSDYSKVGKLLDKYIQGIPKRHIDCVLINRMDTVLKSNFNERKPLCLLGEPTNLVEMLEMNNVYTLPPATTRGRVHDYQMFFDDINDNMNTREEGVSIKEFSDEFEEKKHVSVPLFSSAIKNMSLNPNLRLTDADYKRSVFENFRSFFIGTTNSVDPYNLRKQKNTVVFNRVLSHFYMNTKSSEFDPFEFCDYCLDKCEKRGAKALISIKPQKDVANREIVIQDFFTKASHFHIQTVFRLLNERLPEELVTKSEFVKLDRISRMKFGTGSIFINDDMKKWSGQDIKRKFELVIDLLKESRMITGKIHSLLRKSYTVVENIDLLFDRRLKNPNLEYFTSSSLARGLREKANVDDGHAFTPVRMTLGWPQGLMHFISSFVHGLCSIETERMAKRVCPNISDYYSVYHSDDKNTSVSFYQDPSPEDIEAVIKVNEMVPLSFSLSQSNTKSSITSRGTTMDPEKVGVTSRKISELVSVYNIEGVIVNSWVRQTTNSLSSLKHGSFIDNHNEILSKCCNVFSLSNCLLLPEFIYSYFFEILCFFYSRKEQLNENIIPWGGSKSLSIFEICELGIQGDTFFKYKMRPAKTYYQANNPLVSERPAYNQKMKNEISETVDLRNRIMAGKMKTESRLKRYILEEAKNMLGLGSGLFFSERDALFYNFYRHRNEKNMVLWNDLREARSRKTKLKFKESVVLEFGVTKTNTLKHNLTTLIDISDTEDINHKLDESVAGDENFIALCEKVLMEKEYKINFSQTPNSGVITRFKTAFGYDFSTDFSTALQIVRQGQKASLDFLLSQNWNSSVRDINSFCSTYQIRFADEFERSKTLWEFYKKIINKRNPVITRWKGPETFSDCFLSEKSLSEKKAAPSLAVKMLKKTFFEYPRFERIRPMSSIRSLMMGAAEAFQCMIGEAICQEKNLLDLIDSLMNKLRRRYDPDFCIEMIKEVKSLPIKAYLSYLNQTPLLCKSDGVEEVFFDDKTRLRVFVYLINREITGYFAEAGDEYCYDKSIPREALDRLLKTRWSLRKDTLDLELRLYSVHKPLQGDVLTVNYQTTNKKGERMRNPVMLISVRDFSGITHNRPILITPRLSNPKREFFLSIRNFHILEHVSYIKPLGTIMFGHSKTKKEVRLPEGIEKVNFKQRLVLRQLASESRLIPCSGRGCGKKSNCLIENSSAGSKKIVGEKTRRFCNRRLTVESGFPETTLSEFENWLKTSFVGRDDWEQSVRTRKNQLNEEKLARERISSRLSLAECLNSVNSIYNRLVVDCNSSHVFSASLGLMDNLTSSQISYLRRREDSIIVVIDGTAHIISVKVRNGKKVLHNFMLELSLTGELRKNQLKVSLRQVSTEVAEFCRNRSDMFSGVFKCEEIDTPSGRDALSRAKKLKIISDAATASKYFKILRRLNLSNTQHREEVDLLFEKYKNLIENIERTGGKKSKQLERSKQWPDLSQELVSLVNKLDILLIEAPLGERIRSKFELEDELMIVVDPEFDVVAVRHSIHNTLGKTEYSEDLKPILNVDNTRQKSNTSYKLNVSRYANKMGDDQADDAVEVRRMIGVLDEIQAGEKFEQKSGKANWGGISRSDVNKFISSQFGDESPDFEDLKDIDDWFNSKNSSKDFDEQRIKNEKEWLKKAEDNELKDQDNQESLSADEKERKRKDMNQKKVNQIQFETVVDLLNGLVIDHSTSSWLTLIKRRQYNFESLAAALDELSELSKSGFNTTLIQFRQNLAGAEAYSVSGREFDSKDIITEPIAEGSIELGEDSEIAAAVSLINFLSDEYRKSNDVASKRDIVLVHRFLVASLRLARVFRPHFVDLLTDLNDIGLPKTAVYLPLIRFFKRNLRCPPIRNLKEMIVNIDLADPDSQ